MPYCQMSDYHEMLYYRLYDQMHYLVSIGRHDAAYAAESRWLDWLDRLLERLSPTK